MKTIEEILIENRLIDDNEMMDCHYSHVIKAVEEYIEPLTNSLESMIYHAKCLEVKVEEMRKDEYIKKEFQIRFYNK